jgi:hypothetical protein
MSLVGSIGQKVTSHADRIAISDTENQLAMGTRLVTENNDVGMVHTSGNNPRHMSEGAKLHEITSAATDSGQART